MPAEGSIFDVSPDLSGFSMRPAGVDLQLPDITQPPPSTYGSFNDQFFRAPIAFAQCHKMPGLDTPMTLPIYNLPKEVNIFPDQSAVPTVLASGVSPDSIPWSTAEDIIRDISREGPFDASATPMDTEDSPLISTGLPGRMQTRRMGCSSTTPGSWNSLERRSHDVESSNTGAIRDGVTSDVVGNDEYWRRTCSVSCRRNSEVIHDSEGAASGQIHGSNGPVAPSVGSGCSWASADIVLRILYEM